MNKIFKYIGGLLLILASFFVGRNHPNQSITLAVSESQVEEKNRIILRDYIYDEIRLNEVPKIDLTYISQDDLSQAYGDAAKYYGVPLEPGDDALNQLKEKIQTNGELCKQK